MELRGKTIYISGNSKNCGKTTFMNYLTASLPFRDFARLTIGIDGEKEDAVFGNSKPKVFTKKDEIVVSTVSDLENSDASFNILQVYDWKTCLGKIACAKTIREGHIELAGPETNNQLNEVIEDIVNRGIDTLFIDGAVNRITQISTSKRAMFYFVSTIRSSKLQKSIDELEKIYISSRLSKIDKIDKECHFVKGALTSNVLFGINKDRKIIIEDISKIFLTLNEIKRLNSKNRLFVLNSIRLKGIIVNLFDVDRKTFSKNLNNKNILDKIVFNPYKEELDER